jgi:hypothetical protein
MVAPIRLVAKLRNQSELTQMAYFGGENIGGCTKVDGIIAFGRVELVKS